MESLENQSLGKYEIIREIGRGSMGAVYLARDPFEFRDVAVKVEQHQAEDDSRLARRRRKLFFNEAKAAGMLRHPNIIAVYDAGIEEDMRYLVMEYVPGAITLDRYCDTENLLPFDLVVQIVLQCAMALDYAHQQGVVHRDIKPKNIMLTQDRQVKLADFGIALITTTEAEQTQVIGLLGSPRYMSPEQVMGETLTNQSDIFSLGIVLYELLTGVNPFIGRTMPEIAKNITKRPHRPVREIRPEVPASVAQVLERMLKKHPSGRYRVAMELAGDLGLVHDEMRSGDQEFSATGKLVQLKELNFFEGFEDAEILEVVNASKWEHFEPGERIIIEGDQEEAFYILVSGEVLVYRAGNPVDRLKPGASFGEIGFIIGKARTASIVARKPVQVMKVDAALIERSTITCQLKFQKAFLHTMAERLVHAMGYISRSNKKQKQDAAD